MVVGGEAKSGADQWIGMVTVSNLGIAKVTEKPAAGAGTRTGRGRQNCLMGGRKMSDTAYVSMCYGRVEALLSASTAAGRSRIWSISRSGLSSAIGMSV